MIHQRDDIIKAVHLRFSPKLGLLLLGEAMLKTCKTTANKDNQALGSRFSFNPSTHARRKKTLGSRFTATKNRTEMRRATMERWSIMANLYRI